LGLDLRVLFAFLGAKPDAKDAALSPLELARDVQIRRAEDGEITHVLFRGLEDGDFLFDLDARERVAPLLVPFALLCLLLGLDLALRGSSGLKVVVDRLVSGLSVELQKRIVGLAGGRGFRPFMARGSLPPGCAACLHCGAACSSSSSSD